MAGSEALRAIKPYAQFFTRSEAEVAADLESFAQLLLKWNRVQNLVSRETESDLWRRHIADSLQVLKLLKDDDRRFLDLGSGGGFPALPLAIALKGGERQFILVEPTAKKVSFLRTAGRELGLDLRVEARRSTDIDSRETGPVDVITARALAPLVRLCEMAAPFFGASTRAIFHKGREHVDELAESSAFWHYDVLLTRSDTDATGVLLELSDLRLKSVS